MASLTLSRRPVPAHNPIRPVPRDLKRIADSGYGLLASKTSGFGVKLLTLDWMASSGHTRAHPGPEPLLPDRSVRGQTEVRCRELSVALRDECSTK